MADTKITRRARPTAFVPSMGTVADDFRKRFDTMVDAFFGNELEFPTLGWSPAVEVSEDDKEFTVAAELPGLAAKDVKVDFDNGVLTIRGEKQSERKEEKDDRKFYVWERVYGNFQRSFPFPGAVTPEKIVAEFKDGVLTVKLPKTEAAQSQKKVVQVNGAK